ncbi:MAG: type II toxin-antitoxin system VapB family antitoxin [bacterium]|nr:type II toxin-antitoxin system VapB family antitoxin [bacterium]
MALNIRNPETEQLAEALAKLTGETKTQAVTQALRERLDTMRRRRSALFLIEELDEIATHCASLPLRDTRDAEEILDYDAHGLPR